MTNTVRHATRFPGTPSAVVTLLLLLCLLPAACGPAPSGTDDKLNSSRVPARALPATDEGLKLYERRSEGRVWGSYRDGSGLLVSFDSRASFPNVTRAQRASRPRTVPLRVVTRIEVGGKLFVYTDDTRTQTVRFDGPERPVTKRDVRALAGTGGAAWRSMLRDLPKREWSPERISLGLWLGYLSEAPAGHRFSDETFRYAEETGEGGRG